MRNNLTLKRCKYAMPIWGGGVGIFKMKNLSPRGIIILQPIAKNFGKKPSKTSAIHWLLRLNL